MPISVLLVDDALEVRRLVRTALRFRGDFEVVGEASTGAEAVELAGRLNPELVVLDLGLPDIAGREVLTRIRAQTPDCKVVIFSGAEIGDRAWFEDNTEGYVLKDSDLDYLVDLLESVTRPAPGVASIDLPQDPASVREARRFVQRKLREWDVEGVLDEAFLVVSELAANAIKHAGSSYQVSLSLKHPRLRIEITDSGSGTPEPQPHSVTAESGRGLLLVAALAASWGMEPNGDDGKRVWAELAIPA